jgi:hypothetical protein
LPAWREFAKRNIKLRMALTYERNVMTEDYVHESARRPKEKEYK